MGSNLDPNGEAVVPGIVRRPEESPSSWRKPLSGWWRAARLTCEVLVDKGPGPGRSPALGNVQPLWNRWSPALGLQSVGWCITRVLQVLVCCTGDCSRAHHSVSLVTSWPQLRSRVPDSLTHCQSLPELDGHAPLVDVILGRYHQIYSEADLDGSPWASLEVPGFPQLWRL
jgi:hypothetical protein